MTLLIEMGIGWKPDPDVKGGLTSANPSDYVAEIARLRILLLTANRYVEGYAENDNNHPQARDGARDLVRQIKEAT